MMSLLTKAAHGLIRASQLHQARLFNKGLNSLEQTQLQKLKQTLAYNQTVFGNGKGIQGLSEFKRTYQPSDYATYRQSFEILRSQGLTSNSSIQRFQPSSGSTDQCKWLPYTDQLLRDFDAALAPWLNDFYSRRPEVLAGKHYWSFSWLPESLRKTGAELDDTELFPVWKKALLQKTMAINQRVDLAPSSESSMFASIVLLLATRDLSFVSVWSPTYWLSLLELMDKWRIEIVETLRSGQWAKYTPQLAHLKCPQDLAQAKSLAEHQSFAKIWPMLKVLSCWTSASSQLFIDSITQKMPAVSIIGKGVWTTEGVITVPVQDKMVLALRSHFFEFQDLQDGKIYNSWELRSGQEVSPLITTSGGLYRYQINDCLRVDGHLAETPTFEFRGRSDGTDLVGEKISQSLALSALKIVLGKLNLRFAMLFAVHGGAKPHYCLVLEGPKELAQNSQILIEGELQKVFHYQVARELGQLSSCEVLVVADLKDAYTRLLESRGIVRGNIKFEPLMLINNVELKKAFYEYDSAPARAGQANS